MTDWVNIGMIGGTWFAGLAVLGVYIHQNRKADRRYYDGQLDSRFEELTTKTDTDHRAVKAQIHDLTETVREHYLPRREADGMHNSWQAGFSALRDDFRALSTRIDRLIGGWHGPHSDG